MDQGSLLLIVRGNPKLIESVGDLMREEVRLFISNPETETVSYEGYHRTLEGMAERQGLDPATFGRAMFGDTAVWGRRIHHREAPEALADGRADAAVVYFHLALRYIGVFPGLFDFFPLGGSREPPQPIAGNRFGKIHLGMVGDGGLYGRGFIEFMHSRTAADIYAGHGLCHVQDIPTSGI